jgi:glycosyl hydrolase family 16
MGEMMRQSPNRTVSIDGPHALAQDDDEESDGRRITARHTRGTKIRKRWWGRPSLLGAVALVAVGASVLAVDGSALNPLSHATSGPTAAQLDSPEVVGHAVVNWESARQAALAASAKFKPTVARIPATSSAKAGTSSAGKSNHQDVGPVGNDPSGEDPSSTLPGFTLKYVQEFNGNSIPAGWLAFPGVPGGESASVAQWVPGMCTFSGGEAHFMAQGIDSCGMAFYGTNQEYGAWFARLKGDSEPSDMSFSNIFLLWPSNNQWPPEIDIYEDSGESRSATSSSVINTVGDVCSSDDSACVKAYTQSNGQAGGVPNDGTQWHTYGVEWTPSGVTWLIDGRVIYTAPASQAKSPAQQPATPMNMGLQSQNLQGDGTPTQRETMTVDWVEQYSWNG